MHLRSCHTTVGHIRTLAMVAMRALIKLLSTILTSRCITPISIRRTLKPSLAYRPPRMPRSRTGLFLAAALAALLLTASTVRLQPQYSSMLRLNLDQSASQVRQVSRSIGEQTLSIDQSTRRRRSLSPASNLSLPDRRSSAWLLPHWTIISEWLDLEMEASGESLREEVLSLTSPHRR